MRANGVSRSTRAALALLACMLLVGPAGAVADEADDLIKQILRETRGGAAAAKELVHTARGLSDAPAVQKRLCEKAYECGISAPAGYASALVALDLLAKIAPNRAAVWDNKRLEVYRLQYLRGDRAARQVNGYKYVQILLERAGRHEKDNRWSDAARLYGVAHGVARTLKLPERPAIYQRMRDANNWIVVTSRLAGLKAAVEKNPDDSRSRKRLVETYLIDLDMPAEAAKYLSDTLDPTLRKKVSLAAREASGLADADFLTLGQWYQSLAARTAGKTARARLLTRARDNLRMYLEVYTKKDIQRMRVIKMLKAVEAELKQLGVNTGGTLTLNLGKGVKMNLVLIPAGTFTMGSPEAEKDRVKDEGPQRKVTITKPFYMGATEVTQAQYVAVTGEIRHGLTAPSNPIGRVSWNEAVEFCKVLSKKTGRTLRLPTEAEWEYACRGGTKRRFSFGDSDKDLDVYAWYKDNSQAKPHPVARKKPNPWGLYDMHGNALEWCSDRYGDSYAKADTRDPKGPDSGSTRVLRGGAWSLDSHSCRAAHRLKDNPANRDNYDFSVGFRVVGEAALGAR